MLTNGPGRASPALPGCASPRRSGLPGTRTRPQFSLSASIASSRCLLPVSPRTASRKLRMSGPPPGAYRARGANALDGGRGDASPAPPLAASSAGCIAVQHKQKTAPPHAPQLHTKRTRFRMARNLISVGMRNKNIKISILGKTFSFKKKRIFRAKDLERHCLHRVTWLIAGLSLRIASICDIPRDSLLPEEKKMESFLASLNPFREAPKNTGFRTGGAGHKLGTAAEAEAAVRPLPPVLWTTPERGCLCPCVFVKTEV